MVSRDRMKMWITLFVITLICFSTIQAENCDTTVQECKKQSSVNWIRCYEHRIASCTWNRKGRKVPPGFIQDNFSSSHEVKVSPTLQHRVHIPSSALQSSRAASAEQGVLLVISVLNSSHFEVSPPPPPAKGRLFTTSTRVDGTVMDGSVLFVSVGNHSLSNLLEPVRLIFKRNKKVQNGTCVYWYDLMQDGKGHWSKEGCDTTYNDIEFICSCSHLSFFAVLVNPEISVTRSNAVNLTYITSTGSLLSVILTIISLAIYMHLQRRRPDKAIGVHMHLTGALLCLHLCFLLCSLWAWLDQGEEDWVCQAAGLLLHWSLLATFSWVALEGFHLYLLLVRVFNIYVRRYLLKLSLLGWGFPTVIAAVCGISGAYGKYTVSLSGSINQTAANICWIRNGSSLVTYITVVGFLGLVLLCNSCMLGLVVVKLWGMRDSREGSCGLKQPHKENRARLWKNTATVLGLSCVLGLPWALACGTSSYNPAGIYLFTIFNSLQGVFMFLWSLALSCKTRSDCNSSVKDPSTQKMMETSFNS
ncbi:adhesion G-protein coupled receptor G1 [Myripristis murdjan]|uniref:adhesion G-protein coupled receptor G1 n=1 Tax=Myripristis murdjan TaxID=586833 RepID=UPI0011762012|nr:adhesion G-protein coupled receptor G1-like [Myripristis murdjan]